MKIGRITGALGVVCLLLAATGAVAQERIVLRIGSGHPTGVTYVSQFDTFFVPEVVKRAKERGYDLRFITAWAGTIARLDNISEAVESGTLDIGLALPTFEGSRLRMLNFSNHVAFGTTDFSRIVKVGLRMAREVPEVRSSLRENVNVELLTFVPGENYGINLTRPVSSLEDLKGRKLAASYTTATWVSSIGAVPVGMGAGDVYQSLKTNLIEGGVIYYNFIPAFKFQEIAHYWYKTDFGITLSVAPIMNISTRERLPKEVVEIIDQVAEETAYRVAEVSAQREKDSAEQLAGSVENIQISDDDKRRWAEVLIDRPREAASELDASGIPGTTIFKSYIQFLKDVGHEFPVEYPF